MPPELTGLLLVAVTMGVVFTVTVVTADVAEQLVAFVTVTL